MPCSGCVWATTGPQPDFQAFLGSFCARCARHVWARCAGLVRVTSWPWSYLGYVLAMTGTHADFQAHEGHVQDVSGPRQGRSLTYRNFWAVSGQGVQIMFGKSPGHVLPSISRQFLGHSVQAMSRTRTRPDRDRVAAYFLGIFRQFLGQYAGHIRDASLPWQGRRQIFRHAKVAQFAGHVRDVGTLPGILGSFWDTVCRSCSGSILVAIEKQPNF
ncbi:Hypothetical predicted protein [Olea europaea subsp. europaea]|uniref:Uncharacterized protein n=1 Tax=Olea europaea subsp. europaea TaxID=158383 RepID=A0A8S0STZ1_OLEEU|nr:Hypothetical predicted protein [Olea europaea subsp. europaea]